MRFPFVMRDAEGAIVTATPTVTADGNALTVSGDSTRWEVDAPLGSLVSVTATGAVPLDVVMPTAGATLAEIEGSEVLAKKSDLTPVAKTADVNNVMGAVLDLDGLVVSMVNTVAKESNATANKAEILAAVSSGAITSPFVITEDTPEDVTSRPLGICVNLRGVPQPGVRIDAMLADHVAYTTFSRMDGSFSLPVERGYTYDLRFTLGGTGEVVARVTAPTA